METSSRSELNARIRQQEVVAELGQRALEGVDLDELMGDATAAVADTLDNDYAKVLELLPGGDEVLLRQGVGWQDGLVGSATVPTDRDSQAGYTLLSEEPVIVDDLAAEERFSGPDLLVDHDVVSGISVVIGSVDEPWGVLGTHTTERREFTEHDANFVRSVANVLAAAVDRVEKDRRLEEREVQLERYNAYTDEILHAVDDLFYVVDESGTFQRWNESLTAVTGYSDAEMASMDPLQFVVEEDRDAIAEGMAEIFETGSARVEAEVLTKAGERIPYEFAAARLENPDGERVLAGIGRDVSEREEREQELAKYGAIFETIDDGIYVKDGEGRFTMVNEAYAELTGYDREELIGEHASLVVDEDTIGRARGRLTRGEGGADDRALEAEIETADDDRVPVEGTFATLSTGDDGREEEVGVVRDITERKRREREHRRVIRALEAAREGISLLDEDGEFIYVNDAYAETFRYDPEEMIGEHWNDLGIEADADRFYDDILPCLADEGQWTGTTTCVRSDGSTFLSQHSLTHTDDGELICLVRDITERREREEDLRETRAQLEVATEAAAVGLWTWDVREDVVTTDEYLAETYGVDPAAAAAGAPIDAFFEAIHEVDRAETRERLEEALEETGDLEAEFRIRDADGELSWVVARGEVEYDDTGEPVRLNGAVSDITERKRRERQLEELVGRLEASNERLEQFAYAASHDLQEPLRMVSSYLQLVERQYADRLDEDGREFIEFAVDGADRMRNMIKGLLRYSRVETQGDPFEPVELEGVLANVREDLQVKIQEHDARIDAGEVPRVEGDRGHSDSCSRTCWTTPSSTAATNRRESRSRPSGSARTAAAG